MTALVAAITGFLLGSIPFALLIGLARGVDIRTVGSKNPGATNLGRALGLKWFLLCFTLDAAKGLAPTAVYGMLEGLSGLSNAAHLPPEQAFIWLGVMCCPVLGHMFSPWIGFRGGKGVATGLGTLLGVFPVLTIPAAGAFVVFAVTLAVWRYVGLSSVLASASLPVWTWYVFEIVRRGLSENTSVAPPTAWPFLLVTTLLAGLVIFKHRGNLARVFEGVEPKMGTPT
ncbi:MAG: glycerol-3-phosphate acyltransferase, partial [Phycisphaerales bacterium]|nr:glycerol-3-phosphate acyltransferase [Phycisphaerales bacterium]